MDNNIETDLIKESRTIWIEDICWDEVRDGLFIKRSINYNETFRKIAQEVIEKELSDDN